MARVADIEAENRKAAAEGRTSYVGLVDVDFLDCPPFVMFTADDCSVAGQIYRDGYFDRGSLRLWCELCCTATSIIDIGAFTGIYALVAASVRPTLPIHAFEPNPFSMARLRVNRSLNKLWNIEDHFYGLGKKAGYAQLTWLRKQSRPLSSTATFGTSGAKPEQLETVISEMRPLSGTVAAALGERAVIKVDVEGVEALVLRGLEDLLPHRPDFILETFSAEACKDMNALLGPFGYKAYVIPEDGGTMQSAGEIKPRDPRGKDFNQFISVRPPPPGF